MANDTTMDHSSVVVLSDSELNLVRIGLKLLLEAEDDPQEIEQLKLLIARLPKA